MTVGIGPGASFDVGIPRVLFHAPATPAGFYQFAYTVTADGQRFLFTTPATRAAVPPTTVVVNWASAVGR
jgi:hypothetical protein